MDPGRRRRRAPGLRGDNLRFLPPPHRGTAGPGRGEEISREHPAPVGDFEVARSQERDRAAGLQRAGRRAGIPSLRPLPSENGRRAQDHQVAHGRHILPGRRRHDALPEPFGHAGNARRMDAQAPAPRHWWSRASHTFCAEPPPGPWLRGASFIRAISTENRFSHFGIARQIRRAISPPRSPRPGSGRDRRRTA